MMSSIVSWKIATSLVGTFHQLSDRESSVGGSLAGAQGTEEDFAKRLLECPALKLLHGKWPVQASAAARGRAGLRQRGRERARAGSEPPGAAPLLGERRRGAPPGAPPGKQSLSSKKAQRRPGAGAPPSLRGQRRWGAGPRRAGEGRRAGPPGSACSCVENWLCVSSKFCCRWRRGGLAETSALEPSRAESVSCVAVTLAGASARAFEKNLAPKNRGTLKLIFMEQTRNRCTMIF